MNLFDIQKYLCMWRTLGLVQRDLRKVAFPRSYFSVSQQYEQSHVHHRAGFIAPHYFGRAMIFLPEILNIRPGKKWGGKKAPESRTGQIESLVVFTPIFHLRKWHIFWSFRLVVWEYGAQTLPLFHKELHLTPLSHNSGSSHAQII